MDGAPWGLTQQPDGTMHLRFAREPEIRRCISNELLGNLVYGWLWCRNSWVKRDEHWPLSTYGAVEIWKAQFHRSPAMALLTRDAGTRLLTDSRMDLVFEALPTQDDALFSQLIGGLFGILNEGLLRQPALPSEIKDTLSDIQRAARKLSQALRRLERQTTNYDGMAPLKLVNYLVRETRGYTAVQTEMFSPEQVEVSIQNRSDSVWRLVEEIGNQAELAAGDLKLRGEYHQGQKVALVVRETLKREIKRLLRNLYGRDLNRIGAALVSLMLDLSEDDAVTELDCKKVKI